LYGSSREENVGLGKEREDIEFGKYKENRHSDIYEK
jgi:hypothetical protein